MDSNLKTIKGIEGLLNGINAIRGNKGWFKYTENFANGCFEGSFIWMHPNLKRSYFNINSFRVEIRENNENNIDAFYEEGRSNFIIKMFEHAAFSAKAVLTNLRGELVLITPFKDFMDEEAIVKYINDLQR